MEKCEDFFIGQITTQAGSLKTENFEDFYFPMKTGNVQIKRERDPIARVGHGLLHGAMAESFLLIDRTVPSSSLAFYTPPHRLEIFVQNRRPQRSLRNIPRSNDSLMYILLGSASRKNHDSSEGEGQGQEDWEFKKVRSVKNEAG